jgi:hypothetical protein
MRRMKEYGERFSGEWRLGTFTGAKSTKLLRTLPSGKRWNDE